MIYQPSNSLIESLRSLFKQRVKDGRLAYLGDGTGVVAVAGRKGYVWARFPNGTDGVGNLAYSAPFQVRDTGAAHLGYEGASVYVAVRYNGEPEIVSSNYRELDNAGIDTRVLNPLEPQSKWVYPFQLVIALALAVGTKVTASTKVSVSKLIYYIANTFTEFETTPTDSSLIDLTSYIPAADNHLYAMLWLDPYTNAIEVTTSTTQSLFTPLDATDLQECVTQRPPDGIPLKAFYLANAQSSVTQTSMDVDVRQFLNMPEPLGFPQTLTTKERVRPNRTVILPNYTTSGAGTITLGSGARISIYPHPNLSATANPTVNDDSGDGYSIGSLWVNTTNDTTWVCTDATLGAAVWQQTNISSASFTVAGDSGTPQSVSNGDTLTIAGGTGLSSVASATDTITINLDNTAVTPASYTNANITVDAQGRLTAASNGSAGFTSFTVAGDSGTPQTIADGNTLTIAGGTGLSSVASATDTLTLNLDNTTVTPGSYTTADITVDAQGRITAAANGSSGTTLPVADTTAIVKGSVDATKLLRFEVDGFTTGTTRVLTPPDYDGTIATLAGTETLTNKTLTNPKINEIYDTNGALSLQISPATTAVNYLDLTNSATGAAVQLYTEGSDTDVDLLIQPKGAGSVQIGAGGLSLYKLEVTENGAATIRVANTNPSPDVEALVRANTSTVEIGGNSNHDLVLLNNGSQAARNWGGTTAWVLGTSTSQKSSVQLELGSTSRGFLTNQLTTTQRNSISSPADGVEVFNTTTRSYDTYDSTAAAWRQMAARLPQRAEMRHVSASITTGNALQKFTDANQYEGGYFAQNLPALNDEFYHEFFIAAGTYQFYVYGLKANASGIITWYLDSTSSTAIATNDRYSAALTYDVLDTFSSITIATAGYHRLIGKLASKNASSSNYYASLNFYGFR